MYVCGGEQATSAHAWGILARGGQGRGVSGQTQCPRWSWGPHLASGTLWWHCAPGPQEAGPPPKLPRLCPGLAPPLGASILASAEEGGPSSPVPAVHSATAQKHNGLPSVHVGGLRGAVPFRGPVRLGPTVHACPPVSDCTRIYSAH